MRGGASMRMGAAPPSSAPKSLLAVSGESESEVQLPRFDSPCMGGIFPRVQVTLIITTKLLLIQSDLARVRVRY